MNQDTVILMKNTSRQLNNNVANYLGYNELNANTILGETQYYWLEYRNLTLKKIEAEAMEKISQKSSARNFQQDCWILLDKILQSSLYSKDFKFLLSEWNYAPKDLKVQTLKMYEKAWIDKYHQLPSKTEELLKITSTYQHVKHLSFKEFAQLTTRVLKQIGEYKEEEKENKSL